MEHTSLTADINTIAISSKVAKYLLMDQYPWLLPSLHICLPKAVSL